MGNSFRRVAPVLVLMALLTACSAAATSSTSPSTLSAGPAASPSAAAPVATPATPEQSTASTSTASGTPGSTATPVPSLAIAMPSDALTNGLTVRAVISGGPAITAVVDTGSNGIVVSRRYVGASATPLTPARTFTGFTYSSSGNTYSGEWMTATVSLGATGSGGQTATTSPILIRVVDTECNGGTCNSDASTLSVAMLGVGFDRGSATDPDADITGQAINPFLTLQQMTAGVMPPAYLITQDGITLGPTTADRAGFQTVSLTRTAPGAGAPADWRAPASCVAVPTAAVAEQCGTLLLDTGLGDAIVQVPKGVAPPLEAPAAGKLPTVSSGQQIQVTVTGIDAPIYSFTVGQPGAPTSVEWGHAVTDGQSFMNISRYALTAQDYLYDAGTGVVGFRAHS